MCQRKTKQMREFEPILKANGYREIRSNGSHFIYSNGNNKITVNSYFASIANKYLSDKGSTILGESVNTELVDGLVKVNAKIKTTEGTWKTFSAKIDADGNMFERKFRTITKGVDKLETALKNFSRETSPALTYQETLDKANEIRDKLQLGGEYSIKVDSNELVTITKKLSDVNSTATSVTQTFKSAEDAIQNFGQSASNSAEKTSIALKGVKANTKVSSNASDVESAKQEAKAIQKLAEEKRKLRQQEKQSTQSSVDKALKDQVSAWKQIQSIREKIAKSNDANEIENLKKVKKEYQQSYIEADKILKTNSDLYDKEAQIARLEQVRLDTNAKLVGYKTKQAEQEKNILNKAQNKVNNANIDINKLSKRDVQSDDYVKTIENYRNAINELQNGYNIPDAKELAEVAMIYKNVGDGIDIDTANEYLISTLRGFSLEAKDAMDIIDSINEVANNEPISSAGIGEALQRSAAAFNAANTSLQESIALVTSTNSVLQSPDKVGSMWTTVSARIRGAKTELEDAGLETDGMIESTSKLQAMIKGMTGFDILESDGKTFKSIYDIIVGIGDEFQSLSDIDQAALLEALAGKRQSNALAATLNNIDLLKKAYGEATNAEGSAMAEQEKYQQSIQYSIDRTKASLEELANDFISSDFLKGLIDFGDKLINLLDLLIDKFGVLGTAAGIGGLFAGFKNVGINTLVAY